MYRPQSTDSTMVTVEGLQCYVPPVGYIYDPISKKLVFIGVEGEDRPKKEQYWRRPRLPKEYAARVKEMERMRRHNPEYVDPVVAALRRREWQRRLGGYWFMNCGYPVYITGLHYFYLTYYQLDNRYPAFRMPDLRIFYMLAHIEEDPNAMGLMLLTRRRYGKTFIGGCHTLEYATRAVRASCGIQSKDELTAEKAFNTAIMLPFKKLPDFFQPKHDARSTRRLRFTELDTIIDYRAVGEVAYDGWKLQRYLCDEFGKTAGANILERHDVIKYCLMDVPRIIGKAFYATTVEDMAAGDVVRQVIDLWDASDHVGGRGEDGRTASGLYRMMLPAYETMNFNRFGFPDKDRNMRFIMASRRRALERGDQAGYMREVRKMPNSFKEAVMSTSSEGAFANLMVTMAERMELLKAGVYEQRVVRGRLVWAERRDGPVAFVPDKDGPWQMLVEYTEQARAAKVGFTPNKVMAASGHMFPESPETFGIGVDPYAKGTTSGKVASNGAIAVFRQFDPLRPHSTDLFVATYCFRPHTLSEFYEEVLKACWYFGSRFLHEDNVGSMGEYARSRGYANFMHIIEGRTVGGITTNARTKPRMIAFMEGYVQECIDKIFFIDLLADLIEYDANDSHRFDLAAAAMIALMMCHRSRAGGIGIWGAVDKDAMDVQALRAQPDISIFY